MCTWTFATSLYPRQLYHSWWDTCDGNQFWKALPHKVFISPLKIVFQSIKFYFVFVSSASKFTSLFYLTVLLKVLFDYFTSFICNLYPKWLAFISVFFNLLLVVCILNIMHPNSAWVISLTWFSLVLLDLVSALYYWFEGVWNYISSTPFSFSSFLNILIVYKFYIHPTFFAYDDPCFHHII